MTLFWLSGTAWLSGAVVPKTVQTLELQIGWNLVTLAGMPLQPKEFLQLRPFVLDTTRGTYTQCTPETPLPRGTAVWLFSASAQSVEIALVTSSTEGPEAAPSPGVWSLVGAAGDAPSWLARVARLFQWDARRGFTPVAAPTPGQGYWVK